MDTIRSNRKLAWVLFCFSMAFSIPSILNLFLGHPPPDSTFAHFSGICAAISLALMANAAWFTVQALRER